MRRLIRSSSMGGSADLLGPIINPVKRQPATAAPMQIPAAKKVAPPQQKQLPKTAAAAAEKPRKCIFTYSSPPRQRDGGRKGREYFLDACALCKKKLSHEQDIYMYGNFQAFCSPQCRDDQIALDEEFNPPSPLGRQTGNVFKRNILRVKFNK